MDATMGGYRAVLPDVRFELFEDSRHVRSLEEPEEFNHVLEDFVSSL